MASHVAESLIYLALLALLGFFLWKTRRPRKHNETRTVAPNSEQRHYQWRERLDKTHGLNSETVLDMHARGAVAKRKMLAEIRNRETMKRLRVEGVDVIVKQKLRIAR